MVIEVSKKKEENENEKFKKEESKVEMMMSNEEEMEVMSDLYGDDIDTNIERLKEDMLSTLLDIKSGVIKNDHFGNSRLIDLLKPACGESDEEEEVMEAIEDREVKLGIQLSHLLVDLMIMLSESDRVLERFRTFRSSLEFHEVEKLVAINKFIYLLQSADGRHRIEEQQKLGKVLKDQAWSTLKPGHKQYEEDVDAVEMKVNELGVLSSIFIKGTAGMDESLKQEMELKISELWTQLKDAEEEQTMILENH
ncbi:hypothetical protein LWI28_005476 [Acer negundo]|uniref:Uncharacterized protein n=1 Tax=Acer negundo TaxID=4023 RepID=A0AAD5JQ56_ACENE|nr:hypothetical protein LWI28_005476 [Acer negundo]